MNIFNLFNKKFEGIANQQMMIAPGLTSGEYIKLYGEIGWVYACANRISDAVGQTDFDIVDLKGDIVQNSMIGKLLERPNPFTSKYEFLQMTDLYLSLTGGCYWYIARESKLGIPQEMWIINPQYMKVVPDQNNFIKGYVYQCGAEIIPLNEDEVIYIQLSRNPMNPYLSVSPLHALGNVADTERQAIKYNRNFFYNSAIPQGILKSEKTIPEPIFERLKQQWNRKHQGVGNSHKTAILEGGISYQQISVNNKDSDFINMRASNRDEILAVFGCSKGIMGLGSQLSYAGMVVEEQVFQKYTVSPRVRLIRDKINNELLPLFIGEKDRVVVKTRQNITQDREFIKGVLDTQTNKTITVNESRAILSNILDIDLQPLPDGDTLPKNFTTYEYQGVEENTPDEPKEENVVEEEDIEEAIEDTTEENEKEENGNNTKAFKKKDLLKKINKEITRNSKSYAEDVAKESMKIEKEFSKELTKYFKDMLGDIVENTDEQGNMNINMDSYDERLKEIAEPYIKKAFQTSYDISTKCFDTYTSGIYTKEVMKSFNQKGYIERVFGAIIHRLTILTGVNRRTYKKAQEIVKEAVFSSVETGFSKAQLSKELQKTGLFSPERCDTIAQTEIMGAFNESAHIKYQNINGVDRKAWITNTDELVRTTHQEAGARYSESSPILKTEKFVVGGVECDYPLDPVLPVGEIVNCRCCIMPLVNEDYFSDDIE